MAQSLGYAALALVGTGLFTLALLLARNPPQFSVPRLGMRGLKRRLAMDSSFRLVEPLVRTVAGGIAQLPLHRTRRRVGHRLRLAGDFLGLSPDELIALSVLAGVVGGVAGLVAMYAVFPSPWLVPAGVALGAALPASRLAEEAKKREKKICRALPGAIELAGLCMGAGLDFPGALRHVLDTAAERKEPLYEELHNVLQELELGRTRETALQNFAERVPAQPVRDFVSSVIQAERKGTPLAEVLRIQAGLQRTARSLRIEENASRASVAMALPLLLLLATTMLLIMGPGVLRYTEGF